MFFIIYLEHYIIQTFQYLYHFFIVLFSSQNYYKQRVKTKESKFIPSSKTHKKPEWVKKEIIRIKAIDRKPYQVAFNKIWGMDLTFIDKKPILGIVEHNSRKCLALIPIEQKTTVKILKVILEVLENHSKPKFIRTDNENCFNSKLMKLILFILGIKHQTTDLNSPWQNGRIERFFGTFKRTLSFLNYDKNDLEYLAYSFQWWYNNVRYHQNLDYKTPEFVYQKNINDIFIKKE